jgi:soluble lytic murein transglycosylase-like protein
MRTVALSLGLSLISAQPLHHDASAATQSAISGPAVDRSGKASRFEPIFEPVALRGGMDIDDRVLQSQGEPTAPTHFAALEVTPDANDAPAAAATPPSSDIRVEDTPSTDTPSIDDQAAATQSADDPAPLAKSQRAAVPPVTSPPRLSRDEVCEHIVSAAQAYRLPVNFFGRLIWQESNFDPDSVSHAGAKGIAQFMPETAALVGLSNPFDPISSLMASAQFLRSLTEQFGNIGLAAAAYNAGPERVMNWIAKKSSRLPAETRHYVLTITGHSADAWRSLNPPTFLLPASGQTRCQRLPAPEQEEAMQTTEPKSKTVQALLAAPPPPEVSSAVQSGVQSATLGKSARREGRHHTVRVAAKSQTRRHERLASAQSRKAERRAKPVRVASLSRR